MRLVSPQRFLRIFWVTWMFSGKLKRDKNKIKIKGPEDIDRMRVSGKILASIFSLLKSKVREGVSTFFLDEIIHKTIVSHGGVPAFLGYEGFPFSACISINEEIVHGLPSKNRLLMQGDICTIDIGVTYEGMITDAARTYLVGDVDSEVRRLVDVTQQAFFKGVGHLKSGVRMGVCSSCIQEYVESMGFSVIRDLYSHGVGFKLHEPPLIPNYGSKNSGPILQSGMTFAIEPMTSMGKYGILVLEDGWTIVTEDKSISCQYENTVLVLDDGVEILTI